MCWWPAVAILGEHQGRHRHSRDQQEHPAAMSSAGSASDKLQRYNPILLGTNFLSSLLEICGKQLGPRCLQTISHLSSWYLALLCISLREKQLSRHFNRIAVVRSAEHSRITIKPNEQVVVRGFIDKWYPYHQTCALLQPHPQVSSDLDLTPSLISTDTKSITPTSDCWNEWDEKACFLIHRTCDLEFPPQTSAWCPKSPLLQIQSENVSLQKASVLMIFTRVLSKAEFPVYLYILCSTCARMIVLLFYFYCLT